MNLRTLPRGILLGLLLGLIPSANAYCAPYSPKVVGEGTREGGYFTAGKDGAAISIPGGATVTLAPGASVRVFPQYQRLRMPAGYMTNTWSIAVRTGKVSAEVAEPKRSAVLLAASTKFSVVVADGRGALVVGRHETTAVNERGVAHSIVDGHWSRLTEGSLLTVDDHGRAKRERTPAAPKLEAGQRLWVSTGTPVKVDSVRWTKVAGARQYEVALYQQGEKEPLLEQVTHEPRLDVPFGPLGAGEFDLAVRAVDQRGLAGPWSKRVTLRVIGVSLPDGAYVAADTIHLGQGQKARFTHTDGLLLTHSGAHGYLPATSLVPLYENRRTMVSFRLPGTSELAITKLAPRAVHAVIDISPKMARWPRDKVKVSVQIKQTGPGGVPILLEPHPRVLIGIDPVELEWRQRGNRLEAVVPPSHEKGPWVVRVEVDDQYGVPLGRDFLEVATSR